MVSESWMRRGIFVPLPDKNRVLVAISVPDTVRLLTVMLFEKVLDVVESITTVLLPSLVISADCTVSGATPRDHSTPSCQEPSLVPVQLFVWAVTELDNTKTATERPLRIHRIDFSELIDVPCASTNHCIGRR